MFRKLLLSSVLFTSALFSQCAISNTNHTVTASDIRDLTFFPDHQYSAQVLSTQDALISSQTFGEVKSIRVDVGDTVQRGDTLARLDCNDQTDQMAQSQHQIEGTKAKIGLLKWQLERSQALANQNNTSKERLKTLEADLQWHQSQLKLQTSDLAKATRQQQRCTITAPFDGVVTDRKIQLGEFIQSGSPVVQLQSLSALELKVRIHPEQAQLLRSAKKLQFIDDDKIYAVKVRSLVPSLSNPSHTQEVRLEFLNHKPLPGTLGKFRFEDPRPHIPADYLSLRDNQLGVFVNKQSKALFLPLPQAKEGSPAALEKRLPYSVIVEGRHQLQDGDDVSLIKDDNNEVA